MEEKGSKIQKWFKDNISTLAIAVLCLVYIFYGIVTITETGKTIGKIVADGIISFFMGFLIKSLFNAQGISNGERSEKFLQTKDFYCNILDEIAPIQHYLSKFCDILNNEMLEKNQRMILRSASLDYDKFINNEINYKTLNKKQKRAYNKAMKVKIHYINDAILLSDYQLSLDAGKDLSTNKKKYLAASNSKTLIVMAASAILFGYFSIDTNKGFNWTGMLWSAMQVAYYLGIGAMQFFNGYNYIADTYRTAIIRKTNYLERFRNMYKEDPEQFKPKKEIKQINNEIEKISQKVNENIEETKVDEASGGDTASLEKKRLVNQEKEIKGTQAIFSPLNQKLKDYEKPDVIISSFNSK